MMTKQAELKKQAYESVLKSRALSVLIYLIDRSNKDLTCFPAIPTLRRAFGCQGWKSKCVRSPVIKPFPGVLGQN